MITLQSVSKHFGSRHILGSVSFEIGRGEFISIFGPNGCGKSTLLNILCGLETLDGGTVAGTERIRNQCGFVFQDYRQSLLPWLNVYENVVFPLRLRKLGEKQIRRSFDEVVKLVPINFDFRQRVLTLSGGQAQTVSLMRALVMRPELLILDEPFSALDYRTVMDLRQTLLEITAELKLTTLFVSHDLEEALYLGDKVIFLSSSPTHVVSQLNIPWPRIRTPRVLTTPEFAEIKREALKLVLGEYFDHRLQRAS